MLNVIWPILIVISIIYSFICGNLNNINSAIYEATNSTVEFIITIIGTMCFWSGMINVLKETKIFNNLNKKIGKIIHIIFKDLERNSKEEEYISLNFVSNMLGIGNAATPMGIKAMECMENKNNKSKYMSKNMMLFLLINTASIQIIPTTIISMRNSLGSNNPNKVVINIWITTIIVFLLEVILGKIFLKEEEKRTHG